MGYPLGYDQIAANDSLNRTVPEPYPEYNSPDCKYYLPEGEQDVIWKNQGVKSTDVNVGTLSGSLPTGDASGGSDDQHLSTANVTTTVVNRPASLGNVSTETINGANGYQSSIVNFDPVVCSLHEQVNVSCPWSQSIQNPSSRKRLSSNNQNGVPDFSYSLIRKATALQQSYLVSRNF